MAMIHEVSVQSRTDEGKGASRRLRRAGQVPAVVYGGKKDPQSIQLEHRIVLQLAKHEWFFSSILDLKIDDGAPQKVLLRDWQKHPFKPQMLHMDFLRINEKEAIRTEVPLHFLNQDKSPAHKAADLMVSHRIVEVEISCLPSNLPEYIEVDLGALEEGDNIHMSDLTLPEGIELVELSHGHDLTVVTVNKVRALSDDAETASEAEGEDAAGAESGGSGDEASGSEGDKD